MTAEDQIREFLASELEDAIGSEIKRESSEWVAAYRRWAELSGEQEPLASCVFLAAFARTPGVAKKVERLKDTQGKVRKNYAGTPLRQRFYILRPKTDAAPKSNEGPKSLDDAHGSQANHSRIVRRKLLPRRRELDAALSMRMAAIQLEHPLNAVIDAIESLVRTVLESGGVLPLRARIKALLQEPPDGTI